MLQTNPITPELVEEYRPKLIAHAISREEVLKDIYGADPDTALRVLSALGEDAILPWIVSPHGANVCAFMVLSGQDVPNEVKVPDYDVRLLRAKLTLEEALETIEALGVSVTALAEDMVISGGVPLMPKTSFKFEDLGSESVKVEDVVKEALDCQVIATGTILSFGVPYTQKLQEEVDINNLIKFRTDKDGYRREDGKWVKPSDHPKARIKENIALTQNILQVLSQEKLQGDKS